MTHGSPRTWDSEFLVALREEKRRKREEERREAEKNLQELIEALRRAEPAD